MPNAPVEAPSTGAKVESGSGTQNPQINENVIAQMLQITNGNKPYAPTNTQVDKMLSLYEKGMDYTHKERTTYLPKDVLHMTTYILTAIAGIAVFVFSAFYAKEYVGEIVVGFFAFVAGGVGGYGYGTSKGGKEKKDE